MADLDLRATPEHPSPPPALPCARTALPRTPPTHAALARAHTHTHSTTHTAHRTCTHAQAHRSKPLSLPLRRGAPPGARPCPASGQRGSRDSGARGPGTRRAAADSGQGCLAPTREGSGAGRKGQGGVTRRDPPPTPGSPAALLRPPPAGSPPAPPPAARVRRGRWLCACARAGRGRGQRGKPTRPGHPRAARWLLRRRPAGGAALAGPRPLARRRDREAGAEAVSAARLWKVARSPEAGARPQDGDGAFPLVTS